MEQYFFQQNNLLRSQGYSVKKVQHFWYSKYPLKPGSMQKESAQSDNPAKRKRPKCAEMLGYFDIGLKQKNWTTF